MGSRQSCLLPHTLNENVHHGSALQFGPPTRVVPADRVVAEGQVGPPGQTVKVGVCKCSLFPFFSLRRHEN